MTFCVWLTPSLPAAITNTVLPDAFATSELRKTSFQPWFSVQPGTPSDMLTMLAPFLTRLTTPLVTSAQLAVPVASNGL